MKWSKLFWKIVRPKSTVKTLFTKKGGKEKKELAINPPQNISQMFKMTRNHVAHVPQEFETNTEREKHKFECTFLCLVITPSANAQAMKKATVTQITKARTDPF